MRELQLSQAWHDALMPPNSVAETMARGTIMDPVMFAMMRFVRKQQSGGLSIPGVADRTFRETCSPLAPITKATDVFARTLTQ